MLARQTVCWTLEEIVKVVLRTKVTELTDGCGIDVILESMGIEPTESKS